MNNDEFDKIVFEHYKNPKYNKIIICYIGWSQSGVLPNSKPSNCHIGLQLEFGICASPIEMLFWRYQIPFEGLEHLQE